MIHYIITLVPSLLFILGLFYTLFLLVVALIIGVIVVELLSAQDAERRKQRGIEH